MSQSEKKPVTGWQRDLVIRLDKWIYGLSRHWLAAANIVVAIYVGLPILAPVLMNAGATGPAQAIYTVYSPMCHQMASRSFFLFGEQPAYPLARADTDLRPLEAYMGETAEFSNINDDNWAQVFLAARQFIGNEQMGYKMALCERDIAIYGFVLIGGLLYAVLRRFMDVKPLPFLAFVILGMGPIGLDGFTQLFGYYAIPLNSPDPNAIQQFIGTLFPPRESPPFLRFLTGAWFGLTLVWLAYPRLEESMAGTRRQLAQKLGRIGEL